MIKSIPLSIRIFCAALLISASCPSWLMAQEQLTWQDCLAEAAKNHPDLIAAKEDVAQQQDLKIITASNVLPQVNADLNAVNTHSSKSGSSNSFSYGVSGSQLLFDGFKSINNIHSASENINAAKENFKFTSSAVRLRLRQAFIDLLKAQQLLVLTQDIYKIRKNNLDLITLRYQSGMEHKGALLTAQANVSQANFEINQAKRGTETAQRELTKEMGRKDFTPIAATDNFQVADAVPQEPDYEALAGKNPALLKIIAQKNAAAFDVKADKGDFWPTVSLTGGIGKSDTEWPPKETGSSAGVNVSLPLFEGGARVAKVAEAASIYRQLEQEERSLKDGIVLTLSQKWNALQDAVESVNVQKDFLTAAEERANIAEQQYSVGLVSFDNWTIIEDDLVNNKKSFLNVQTNALVAEANWIQAKGETLEYEN